MESFENKNKNKIKPRNEKYIKENFNDYEVYAANAINDWDLHKLKNCLSSQRVRHDICVNDKGTTLLHYAATKRDSIGGEYGVLSSILTALLKWGANQHAVDSDGLTAKDYAEIRGFKNNADLISNFKQKK